MIKISLWLAVKLTDYVFEKLKDNSDLPMYILYRALGDLRAFKIWYDTEDKEEE